MTNAKLVLAVLGVFLLISRHSAAEDDVPNKDAVTPKVRAAVKEKIKAFEGRYAKLLENYETLDKQKIERIQGGIRSILGAADRNVIGLSYRQIVNMDIGLQYDKAKREFLVYLWSYPNENGRGKNLPRIYNQFRINLNKAEISFQANPYRPKKRSISMEDETLIRHHSEAATH